MGRQNKKIEQLGPIARYQQSQDIDAEQSHLAVITPQQRAKGTYDGDGRRIVNRGGTPIMRWIRDGRISETQALAISHCLRLWSMVGLTQNVTASYGERMAHSDTVTDSRVVSLIEARQDLYRIQDYVPKPYFDIFENVCRFDEPAGIAGSRMGFGSRSAQDRAHTIVCMVADTIAMREGLISVVRILVA